MAGFDATLGGATATSYISIARGRCLSDNTQYTGTWQGNTEADEEQVFERCDVLAGHAGYAGTRCSPSTDDRCVKQAT